MPDPILPKRFRFVRQLGEGGMGVVYEALDEERQARVAVKTIRNITADSLSRFKREFRALADVHHPNVISLGELFSEGADWFFSMELVEGDDFLSYVRPAEARWRAVAALSAATVTDDGHVAAAPTARFSSARDDAARFDEARLRSALQQLAGALAAIHDAGVVHRDIKPSNIRVTGGRLVLLDFGLAIDQARDRSTVMNICGTPAYMAPEQALSGPVGPEADWYSAGVLLYEALTGEVPFDGAPLEVLTKKQSHTPAPPRALVPDVPIDLDALCVALLQFDPKARPTAATVQGALGASETAPHTSRSSLVDQSLFVGRVRELDDLGSAFRDSRSGASVSVLVEGESGMGKSCLVRRFVTASSAEEPDLLVLAGRCYEREAVPYKALDGVVNALTHVLIREGDSLAKQILPTRPAPLAQLFPVLRRVAAVANATRGPAIVADPVELRSRAFAALREMLTRLASERPCLVVIDDLQWADADSLALLTEVMRPPDEPPLLFVATVRVAHPDDDGAAAHKLAELRDFIGSALAGRARVIVMERMLEEDARALTARLLERSPGVGHSADAIAQEAGGHPLFIDALVRHSAVAGATSSNVRLEDALWARVASLAESPRRVMQVLAVAGAPITQDVLAGAVGGDRAELERHVSLLRVEHLASITGGRAADTIEPYHDCVRAAVLTNLTSDARVACHRALAMALEQAPRPEPEALARHWRGAGDPVQAARYSVVAADEAAGALAFDRAVALYEAAIDLGPGAGAERSALKEKLGDALANAGRGKRAAEAYAEASQGAHAARSLDLQRRAADQLLRTGHFDEGIDALERVLASIGLSWPRSPLFAVVFFLAYRLYVRLRGLGFRPRDARDVAAPELARADIVWSVTFGIGFIDNVSGSAFQARNLIFALRSGERARISRAIGVEACYSARRGARASRQTEALVERAHALAVESENSHAIGWAHTASVVSYYLLGRYKQALEHVAHARTALANVPGSVWELDTATFFGTMCLVHLGKIGDIAREVPAMVRDARRRGDLYAAVNLRLGFPNIAWLALDDGDGALAQINEALAEWSKRGFHLEHYYELVARTNALLYSGHAGDAHTLVTTRWPALSRSLLPFTIQSVRINSLHARARSAIAMAGEGGDGLLREAAAAARRLERERAANGIGYAKLVRAGIAATRKENPERAVLLLREAISTFDGAEMALYAGVARRCLGVLLGGEEGRELVRVADVWMTSECIKNPARMAAMLAPGFGFK